MKENKLVSM